MSLKVILRKVSASTKKGKTLRGQLISLKQIINNPNDPLKVPESRCWWFSTILFFSET